MTTSADPPARPAATAPELNSAPATFTGSVLSGFKWKTITSIVSEGTRVCVAVVLARILSPKDYGLAGMAFVFSGFVMLFSDLSLGGALVQRREIDDDDLSTVFWGSLAVSAVIFGATVALAGPIAAFFGQPEVRNLLRMLALSIPLAALSTTQTAVLTRRLAYRSLEIRSIVGVVSGGIAAVILAVLGAGAYAIVANAVITIAISTALVWRLSAWRPRFVFSRASVGNLGGFGLNLFGIRLLNYGNNNVDNLLIGRFAGATQLGIYSVAFNLMFLPINRIAVPIWGVVYPALARMQDDRPRLHAAWLKSKRLSNALLAPIFFAILITAPDLIRVVLGSKWHAAVPVAQLLCVAGLAGSAQSLNAAVLQAVGMVGTELRLDLITTAVTLAAFGIGVHWGAKGVALSYAVARWLIMPVDTWVTTRAAGVRFRDAMFAGASMLPLAAAAAAAAYLLRLGLVHAGVPAAGRLFAVGATFAVAYLVLTALVAPGLLAEVRATLRRRAIAPA